MKRSGRRLVRSALRCPCMRKGDQCPDRSQNFIVYFLSSFQTVGGNEIPNLFKIGAGFRVKRVSGHEPGWSLALSYF